MNNQEFLARFETATLHPFQHRDHIRVAWLYLTQYGWDEGYLRLQAGIKHFAVTHGQASMYHETITRFWATIIHYHIVTDGAEDSFDAFINRHPALLDKTLMTQHYSADVLKSTHARTEWVEPDLTALPVI
ncbi:MAG: hypothetical protein L0154_13870 [Chloroflexi bacterium]|nr:hypothetical protein [Chloroflexota bacterium]